MADLPTIPAAPPPPKPPAKPPGKLKKFFLAIFGWPKKLWRMSVPAKAAWLTAVALIAVVAVAWIAFFVEPESVPWRHAMTTGRIIGVVCLLVLIPLVVYRALKLWLEGDSSRFPDLDFAWRAGLTALERNGLDITSTPIFLVLGAANERQERALFDAAGLSLRVRAVPEGPAPLHWYASPEAVYVCCTEASWMSALSAFESTRAISEMASALPSLESPVGAPVQYAPPEAPVFGAPQQPALPAAPAPASPAPRAPAPAPTNVPPDGGGDDIRGTIMLGQYAASLRAQGNPPPAAQPAAYGQQAAYGAQPAYGTPAPAMLPGGMVASEDPSAIHGTMMLQAPVQLSARAPTAPAAPPPPSYMPAALSSGQRQTALLSPQESAEQLERLQHVCHLLRRARQPLCAVNGIVALMPLNTVQGSPREVDELQRAVRADLQTIGRSLELRCPVTALVVGLEQEAGFRELVRRVGRERAAVQRFGQRYDVRSVATPEEMNSLCAHVCGAFEDWVYTLFREQGALSRPGNTQLYGLLCKVRLAVKNRLAQVLAGGFGQDPQHSYDDAILFSGCYFAAIGESEDRQAFAKGVFNKLIEEQEQVEWTPRAMRNHRRYLGIAWLGLALDAVLIITLGAMIVWRFILR